MQIDEGDARLFGHLAIPAAEGVVAALDMHAVGPLVARRQGDEDGRGALLAHVVNHLAQIPAEGVDHLVAHLAVGLHAIDVGGVGRAADLVAGLAVVNLAADVVVAELYEHEVAGLHIVDDLVPAALAQIGAARASGLGAVLHGDVILSVSKMRSACDPHPHMPVLSLSVFLTVESPVMNTTGLPFWRFTPVEGSAVFVIMALQGFHFGVVALQQSVGSAPGVQLCAEG